MKALRIIIRTIRIILSAILILVVAAWILVHTPSAKRFLLSKIEKTAETSLGSKVQIVSMSLAWTHLSAVLHDVTVFGNSAPSQPPFVSIRRVAVQLEVAPLFQKRFRLALLTLQRPIIHFLVNKEGQSNVPHPPASRHKISTVQTLLNLQVRKFKLDSGELDFRNKTIPLSAELSDLRSTIAFDAAQNAYSGALSYSQGSITTKTAGPIYNRLQAAFTLTRSALDLHPLTVQLAGSRFSANIQVNTFSSPQVNGSYTALVATDNLSALLRQSLLIHGEVAAAGSLHYRRVRGSTFMQSIIISGELHSAVLIARYRGTNAEFHRLYANYRVSRGNLHVWNLSAGTLGGALSGNLEMAHFEKRPRSQINISLCGVSLSALTQAAKTKVQSIQRVRLLGTANISVAALASSTKSFDAHARIVIHSPSHQAASPSAIPLSGVIDVAYDSTRDAAVFQPSFVRIGATQLALSGTLSRNAHLNVRASTTNLHQLSALAIGIARRFRSSKRPATTSSFAAARLRNLNGQAQFSAIVSGHVKAPTVQGKLSAQNLAFDGFSWRSLQTHLAVSPSEAAFQSGLLQNGSRSRIAFSGRIGLQHWALAPNSPLQFHTSLQGISLAQAMRIAGKKYPVTGTLAANLTIRGTRKALNGGGNFQITNASAWNQKITTLKGNAQLVAETITLSAQAQMPAGSLAAKVSYALNTKAYNARITVPALNLTKIQFAKLQQLGVSGTLHASISGQGTFQQPSATASLQVANFQIHGESLSQAQAQVSLHGKVAGFSVTAAPAQIRARVAGNLGIGGQYPIHATLDVPSISLRPLLASFYPSASHVQGHTAIHGTVDGPLKNISSLHARLVVPALTLSYDSAQLALARPLTVDYSAGVVSIARTELKGTGTDVTIAGRIPLQDKRAAANLSIKGAVDLAAFQSFGPSVQSSGKILINISDSGDLSALRSRLQGQIQIVNAEFFTAGSPVGVDKLNADFHLASDRISIKRFNARIGSGTLTAQGDIAFARTTSFNLSFQGNRIRILYPRGIRSILTASLQLNGTTKGSQLSGRVLLDQLSFTRNFDVSTLMSGLSGTSVGAGPSPFLRNMKLNIHFQSTRELQLASSQVRMGGAANLNIVGTAANPVILGRVALTSGVLFFMGKRYQVQSGTISFANPARTEPVVNVYVMTVVNQYRITLNFVGPVSRLRTNYTSVPPLSPADIINVLAFGQTTEQAAAAGSTPASVGAETMIAQGVASQFSSKLQNLTGLSQLTISPTAGSNQSGPGAQVAVQEQVTGNLLLTFSTDVTATQDTAVQVQYSATKHVSVSVLRDVNGGYALDIHFRKSF